METPNRDSLEPYAGMTVNERLAAANLFERWDGSVIARDRGAMIEVLVLVGLESQAAWIADTVLANPALYGFNQ